MRFRSSLVAAFHWLFVGVRLLGDRGPVRERPVPGDPGWRFLGWAGSKRISSIGYRTPAADANHLTARKGVSTAETLIATG
jgi:hypothetical protein